MYCAAIEIMYSTISVFILMGLPVVATSLSSRQQQSKPIGSPKALLYHMMDRAHNRLSNLVSASTQSFPVQEPSALVWHGWIYIPCDTAPATNETAEIVKFSRSWWFKKGMLLQGVFIQGF